MFAPAGTAMSSAFRRATFVIGPFFSSFPQV
jgi:hypothetical protein